MLNQVILTGNLGADPGFVGRICGTVIQFNYLI